jgi:hypothetical protein
MANTLLFPAKHNTVRKASMKEVSLEVQKEKLTDNKRACYLFFWRCYRFDIRTHPSLLFENLYRGRLFDDGDLRQLFLLWGDSSPSSSSTSGA